MNRMAIEARVNGAPQALAPGTSVADVVRDLIGESSGRGVAVARNGAVITRAEWTTTRIETGDEIEIVRPIQGG
jgi:sulfur carrier protein